MVAMSTLRRLLLGLPLLGLLCLAPARAACADDAGEAARRKQGGHADLVLDRYEHDFGQSAQNQTHTARFTYTNAGDKTVDGIKVKGECGCNRMTLSHDSLEPGASGTLEVQFATGTLGGRLRKRLHLFTADYKRGSIVVPVKIAIIEGLVIGPSSFSFGRTLVGKRPTKAVHLKWYQGVGTPFEVTGVAVPGHAFKSRVVPYVARKDPKWKGWTIELTFEEDPPLGMFSAEVRVRTTHATSPELTVPLSANFCGKIWMQARTLSFGAYDQGAEKTASLKFRPFDKSVEFGDVKARSRSGRLRVEAKPDPFHAKAGYWRLYGTVPADREPGSLDAEIIELHTGIPGEEVTLVKVRGTVRAPRAAPDRSSGGKSSKDKSPDRKSPESKR